MSIAAGSRVGPYEIVSQIGAGGMGEVFRAHDVRLNRDVAIKVLPEAFAQDKERLARFRREAQVVASLNHPNIAGIFGLEESNGTAALALELVEGEDLAQHLTRGAIPVDEAIAIARQIAEGLETAHEKGFVHRDLKPANIKLTRDGAVKILDFGLAKAFENDEATSDSNLAHSPTMARPMTDAGMILGTASYMSPEQARGKPVDKRSDIWSFGVVLFEMLTGGRLFEGETVSDVLAAVLTREPDWTTLPKGTPRHLRHLLERCLERDLKQRLRDIGEARIQLVRPTAAALTGSAPVPARPARRELIAWSLLGLTFLGVIAGTFWHRPTNTVDTRVMRLAFAPPENVVFDSGTFHNAVISPDGRKVVFSGRGPDGRRQLWVRHLESDDARALPDSFEGIEPFWSPDSQSIAFGAQGKLKRVDLSARRAVTLCNAPRLNAGSSWGRAGVILFVPDYGAGLFRVDATGGTPEVVVRETLKDQLLARAPSFLPDGRRFLYSENARDGKVFVASLDSEEVTHLPGVPAYAVFAAPGWLLSEQNGQLAAQELDLDRLRVKGDPRVLSGVPWGPFSTSENGVLLQQSSRPQTTQLVWYDRRGTRIGVLDSAEPRMVGQNPTLSRDGKSVVVQRRDRETQNQDIWAIDVMRGTASRLTTNPALDQRPVWSASGTSVYFNGRRDGVPGIYQIPASGGPETVVLEGIVWPLDVTPDGRFLLFDRRGLNTRLDVWALPLSPGGRPYPLLNSEFDEGPASVSPDGRWLAYGSDLTGTSEIYVRPFTADGKVGPATRVSANGGRSARWSADGRELFFLAGPRDVAEEQMSAVTVSTRGEVIEFGPPAILFNVRLAPFFFRFSFSVSADGQRFLIDAAVDQPAEPSVSLLLNWPATLKR